jgi:hypothetical protein
MSWGKIKRKKNKLRKGLKKEQLKKMRTKPRKKMK